MDQDKGIEKSLYTLEEKPLERSLEKLFGATSIKENHILFPTTLRVEKVEWREMRQEFGQIGYCCFASPIATVALSTAYVPPAPTTQEAGYISSETGVFRRRN